MSEHDVPMAQADKPAGRIRRPRSTAGRVVAAILGFVALVLLVGIIGLAVYYLNGDDQPKSGVNPSPPAVSQSPQPRNS